MSLAAALALVAAFLFALAAALQQKGALNLPTISLADPKSLVRLLGEKMWLIGTLALFSGYLFQAAALDRGRLSVIQPLLVTTVVFALPLGYFLTKQHVGRREVIGAAVILVGLALFVYFGDPAGGKENASNAAVGDHDRPALRPLRPAAGLRQRRRPHDEGRRLRHRRGHPLRTLVRAHEAHARLPAPERRARCSPTGSATRSRWPACSDSCLQQVSLGTGRLAPSVATVSVANPVVGILIGMLLLDESAQPSRLAHRAGRDRPQPGARRGRRHLARARGRQGRGVGRPALRTAPAAV